MPADTALEQFITAWKAAGAAERANSQLFLTQFCQLLELPVPEPAKPDDAQNAYIFERAVKRVRPDGTITTGSIDLYRRGCFVLESNQGVEAAAIAAGGTAPLKTGHGKRGSAAWDLALERAYHQACGYVKDLPSSEGRPPFVIVCDVGHCFEFYSEFTCTGGTYVRFPDPHRHRITLDDLRLEPVRERLRRLWLDPLSLDPSRKSAKVTRKIAALLAQLATSLEADGHDAQVVAAFLQRCLFSLFAEDTGLLPEKAFTSVIERSLSHPQGQVRFFEQMWAEMDKGTEFSTLLNERIRRFNGEFFRVHTALPLDKVQLRLLADAAKADWTTVEPAIFGTLLERALDPATRHRLGAHYTPRAYVERLVFPTVINPLRAEWDSVKAAAAVSALQAEELRARIDAAPLNADGRLRWIADEKKLRQAAAAPLIAFQKRLADIRVLDPACGSGNFLYVTFEHLKRLEGEVLELEEAILSDRAQLDMDVTRVHPSHFLGIELNPRAAALAELVLWIGYLQWQHRSGKFLPDDPVLSSTRSVQCGDAVLAYDGMEAVKDENGQALRRWDGRTMKKHPVTGEEVPDESAQVPVLRPVNPRPAPPWPEADYIVGNPPFIGNKRMRIALGDGYTDALRKCWPDVPESADFVMYWWHRAASLLCQRKVSRFGLITTNSITQIFNRSITQQALDAGGHIRFAVGDHPWVDSADGAQVRVAMSVLDLLDEVGELGIVTEAPDDSAGEDGSVRVSLEFSRGTILSDMTIGVDTASLKALRANFGIACPGVQLSGQGFIVPSDQVDQFCEATKLKMLRRYITGKDVMQGMREQYVLDTYGTTKEQLFGAYPDAYQWVLDRVKPERDHNPREKYRRAWWIHAEPRGKFRSALHGLRRFVITSRTARHRVFQFLDCTFLPETKVLILAFEDAQQLGILSSCIHVAFANRVGGWLGVGNDSTYNHSDCLEKFPFPAIAPNSETAQRIRALGEQLDAHRKARQAAHPELTLTGMYNVLTKLRGGDPLTAKEKVIHEQGLVSVLQKIHDDLDRAVLEAYGWSDIEIGYAPGEHTGMAYHDVIGPGEPPPEGPGELWNSTREAILTRLAALNAERAAEEAAGHIRYLRPDFQAPGRTAAATSAETEVETELPLPESTTTPATAKAKSSKLPWPADLPSQATALRQALAVFPHGTEAAQIAGQFQKAPKAAVNTLLETLCALGQARNDGILFFPV
ncbi:MAG TPA: DNA methyltransferase [Verrucomicrobiales bacterium]|nr:DNA methyltransferase [Verrucomicrobiales bacterium]